ncbi:MAG TPA: hypothetical protein VG456_25115 [Candidatus Sulfopaludibacter sp.]|nr:hypothetical protein [Candidatus Sulfopaludibacter sp.]
MNEQADVLIVSIADDATGSPEQLEQLTLQLRRAIRELPVDAVDPIKESTAHLEGNKSIDGAMIGQLAIKLLPQAIPLVIQFLQKWKSSAPTRKLSISCGNVKIDISGELTPEQSAAIVKAMAQTAE